MSALIEAEALAAAPEGIKFLDATFGVPDPMGGFLRAHIGQAQFFDIDEIADDAAPYPHTVPDATVFAAAVGALGIGQNDRVVVYDQTGLSFAAARAWWMFRLMGHENVQVLNGGLPAWLAAGLPVESGPAAIPEAETFIAHFQPQLYRDFDAMETISETESDLVVDARGAARFEAQARGPDGDMQPAHIPGSRNLPFAALLDETGRMRDADACAEVLAPFMDDGRAIVASCGSGVTACVLALGFYESGATDVAVYDGSWTEWSDRMGLR